ncbi:MAG TPA: PAS domain S-box protein, partial [Mucilaginibacter sp.]|nr:PAS domain S-box protein [Mucilaginibacter sp.]
LNNNKALYKLTSTNFILYILLSLLIALSLSFYIIKNIKTLIRDILNSNDSVKKSEERYRTLIETACDAIYLLDFKGNFTDANEIMCEMTGYSKEELLRMNIENVIDPEQLKTDPLANGHRNSEKSSIRERRFISKHGKVIEVEINVNAFADDQVLVIARDITERKQLEAKIRDAELKFRTLAEKSMVGVYIVQNGKFVYVNPRFAAVFGYEPGELINTVPVETIIHEDYREIATEFVRRRVAGESESVHYEAMGRKKDGTPNWVEFYGSSAIIGGKRTIIGSMIDVTESRYYPELDKLEKEILELNARNVKNIDEIVGIYLSGIEAIHPGMLCSLQEKRGGRLFNMASPSLPKKYLESIEGIEIGNNKGSCGTAAFLKQEVIVTDISNDIRWADYKEIASQYHLKSCWSYPVLDGKNNVMATFACYYGEIKTPSNPEENTIKRAGSILQVILESYQRAYALKISNERFEYVTKATSDIIWDWNLETNEVYYSDNMKKLFGHASGVSKDNLPFYSEHVHPDDRERVILYPDQVKYGDIINWTDEYRFRKADGEYAFVQDKGIVIRNKKGEGIRMVGAMQDITEWKKTEQALETAYSEKNTILESIGDAFFAVDQNWVVTYWNNHAEQVLQVAKDAILGHNLWEVFTDSINSESYKNYHLAIETNQVIHFEDHYALLNAWYEISAYPSRNGLSVYFKDITERKLIEHRLRTERNLLRTLIDNLPQSVYFKDKDARKLISNKVDYELLGIKIESEALGKTDLDVLPPEIATVGYEQDMMVLDSGKPLIDYEHSYITENGTRIWLLTTKIPLFDERYETIGLLGIGRDITEQKFAEKKLRELNAELEKNIKQLIISNAELEQFAYVASHDLQEPLRMVTSFMTQLEKKYSEVIDEKGRQYIRFAVDGAKRMRQIILDLLDFSRVGSTEDDMEDVDFNKLLTEILGLFRRQIEESHAEIRFENLPVLHIYKTPVRQVFQNLVGNSLKYHRKDVAPVIEISCKETKTYYQFSVKDNGIGIAPEYFDKIFIIFQRLHNRDEYSGTGMGLAITKKIVESLGGKIWLESEEGKGSTFYFTLLKK